MLESFTSHLQLTRTKPFLLLISGVALVRRGKQYRDLWTALADSNTPLSGHYSHIILALIFSLEILPSVNVQAQDVSRPTRLDVAETARLEIDFNTPCGKIRRLNGTNLGPPLRGWDISADLQELEIPVSRLHDASVENAGMQLVDISRIFPLFHADAQNPDNYCFGQTDDYIAKCLATGTRVSYRLGESIEHTPKKYCVHPPIDYDKWADICVNIIRHYNEGWANGFHYNIDSWCIWEEANLVPKLWTGTWDDYIRLYVTASRKIKQRFPAVQVGGPAMSNLKVDLAERFIAACQREGAPLDFFGWNAYFGTPQPFVDQPRTVRALLDEYGFTETKVHVTEWNYTTGEWNKMWEPEYRSWFAEEMKGPHVAALLCAVLSGWQDTPIDMGYYYVGSSLSVWGLFDSVHRKKNKNYFGMKAFARIAKYETRAKIDGVSGNLWALAGTMSNNQGAVLLSCFKSPASEIKIAVTNRELKPDKIRVFVLDAEHDLEPLHAVAFSRGEIILSKPAGSSVFLIEGL